MAVSRTKTRVAGKADARADGHRRNGATQGAAAFTGRVRLGKRTKRLVKRLDPSDIAVIDHAAIDRVSGEDLVATGVGCVLNCARSASPRYGNQGPVLLTDAGVHLVDMPAASLFDVLKDGEEVTVRGGKLYRGEELIGEGDVQDAETVQRDHKKDLRALRPYVRDMKPILIAVDGGADAILEEGHKPDMIVGDMDSATDRALQSGAELVVHAYRDGRAPGRARLDRLGLDYSVVPAAA